MKFWAAACILAVVLAGCLFSPAAAQEGELDPVPPTAHALERPLTDKNIERWLPRLRAEAAAFTKQVSEAREGTAAIISTVEEREKLLADMASGKTDIAAWMRSQTDYALVPAGAVYCDKCSQALVYESGAAVFTFEKESPYRELLRRTATGDEAAHDEFNIRRSEEEVKGRTATQQAMNDFVAGIAAFYFDHGFVEGKGANNDPIFVRSLHAPDERVSVAIWEANPYCGLMPGNIIPPCAALPTGPLIEISLAGESGADAALAPANDTLAADTAEEKPDPDYERVRNALLLARMDADDPSALEFDIPPDAPPEVKAKIASIAAEFAPRKANVLMYKRHEAELAPILDALLELSEK